MKSLICLRVKITSGRRHKGTSFLLLYTNFYQNRAGPPALDDLDPQEQMIR